MFIILAGALVIGLSLGVMGSGGSILTVPVLTYLLGHPIKAAIAESLAIVGGIALVGSLPYARSRQVDWIAGWRSRPAGAVAVEASQQRPPDRPPTIAQPGLESTRRHSLNPSPQAGH